MIIATFNINNVNRRLPNLLEWLGERKPDVACLQELKADQQSFPADDLARAGYHAVWQGQRTWNGVAILARGIEPILTRTALPGDAADIQARYIEAAVNGVLIACIYAPNGNPQPGPKFDYKLAWLERLRLHATRCRKTGAPVVLAGDYNVAPTEIDIYPTKSWDDDALIQPESRAAFKKLVGTKLDRRAARKISRTSASTHSGTTSASAGRAMQDFASTISCSRRPPPNASPTPASTARCAAATAPATMRRPGSGCARFSVSNARPTAPASAPAAAAPGSSG